MGLKDEHHRHARPTPRCDSKLSVSIQSHTITSPSSILPPVVVSPCFPTRDTYEKYFRESPPVSPLTPFLPRSGLLQLPHREALSNARIRRSTWHKPPVPKLLERSLLPVLCSLLPSFFSSSPKPRKPLSRTAWLDGLRGLAACTVLISHHVTNWYYHLRLGYHSTPTLSQHAPFPPTNSDSLWQLPIIRLLYSGRAGVAIFFVISGFALSYKPLKLIRHHRAIKSGLVARIDPGDSAESARGNVLAVMGSSLLRRGIRLFVPVVAGTFIAAILAYLDAFTPTPLRNEVVPAHFPTLSLQLRDWWSDFEDLMFPFRELNPNHLKISRYNGHLWTIPLEFYGSMAVFLGVLGLSGAKPLVRMGLLLGVGAWGLVRGRWDVWLFLTGVVLAEWSLILEEGEFHEEAGDEVEVEVEISEEERKASWGRWADVWQDSLPLPSQLSLPRRESQQHHHHQQQQQQHQQHRPLSRISSKILLEAQQHVSSPIPSSPKPFISILNLTLLLLSLYILSYPGDSPTPGPYHAPLLPWTPLLWDSLFLGREHYWHALSAPLLLLALANSRACQRPFTTSLAQYLGSISYSLYITHGLVLFTLGTGLQERWTGQVGVQTWKDNGFGALMETQARPDMGPRGTEMYSHAFAVTSCVCGVLCVWAADVFWRGVDGRVVLWGRKIERLLS